MFRMEEGWLCSFFLELSDKVLQTLFIVEEKKSCFTFFLHKSQFLLWAFVAYMCKSRGDRWVNKRDDPLCFILENQL